MPETATHFAVEDCQDIVLDSLSHVLAMILPGGKFIYAHTVGDLAAQIDGYNLLRHCGTLWFILRAINAMDLHPGKDEREALSAAVGYAGSRMQEPDWLAGDAPTLALVTKGAVKTGGVGLALVMLAEFGKAKGMPAAEGLAWPVPQAIAGLQRFALAQVENGDFRHKLDFATGAVLPFRSDYYTGEVLLGLLVTECADPAVARVAQTLLTRRYGVAEQSHWMAYAACEAAERGLVATALAQAYLTGLATDIIARPDYRARMASTPIACRSEALTRILMLSDRMPGFLPDDLLREIRKTALQNMALQLRWYLRGQFWKGDGDLKVQIDYIQHNATCFLNLHLHDLAATSPQRGN